MRKFSCVEVGKVRLKRESKFLIITRSFFALLFFLVF